MILETMQSIKEQSMTDDTTNTSGCKVLELKGDLTISEVTAAHENIVSELSNQNGTIILDVSGVDAVDAAGLQLIIAAQRSGAKISSISPALEKVAAILGLSDALVLTQIEVN
jgi:anti-anti-sigma factor